MFSLPRALALSVAFLPFLASCGADVAIVKVTGDDKMQFAPRSFSVTAGQAVELTLTNIGVMPKEGMAHNIIILKKGLKIAEWGAKLIPAGASADNEYFPESMRGDAIAFSKQLGPGESDTIKFTAPTEKGEYNFVCTFPGHYMTMNGVMLVK